MAVDSCHVGLLDLTLAGVRALPPQRQAHLRPGRQLHAAKPVAGSGPCRRSSREAFEAGLLEVSQTVVERPASPAAPRDVGAAFAALSSLVGAVTLARAVGSPALSEQVASTAERLLLDAKVGKAHAGGR